ncbi:methyltransferase domain-containing protein [Streptomyces scabiei]|uniref:class I SAM-dependent methyltransferase n=1 Tax=Streptomyces scabiei TaxID=1930 RepID=UPI001B312222|nr:MULTISPECIES: methyltransferase domain-containing protein [Streptomyces]MDX3121578.1 methyltransferase domain-containing protein [Streptomyces scabiei]MDX3520382.1 methyltransferase domain-containing protein [Streptomyces scabiei]QTU46854.1 methyltransferase domain-containing protein [Streptomyces sp. LBUM 1482]
MTPYTNAGIGHLAQQIAALLQQPTITHGLARALRAAEKEIDVHRTHSASLTAWPSGRIEDKPRQVQIGGGAHQINGYFSIDVVPPADLLWDIREGIPLYDSTVDLLFSEHFLEHIDYPRSAKYYAREAHRVLAPGGRLITGVPDAAFVLRQYPGGTADGDKMIRSWYGKRNCLDDINTHLDLINYVFRDQDDDPTYHPHFWAYDHEKLVQLFTEAGFASVEPWDFDPKLANPKREWGSVYVIATK